MPIATKNSLLSRLTWGMWLLALMTCLISLILATSLIYYFADQQERQRLRSEEANLVALGLVDMITLNPFQDIIVQLRGAMMEEQFHEIVRIFDVHGQLLYSSAKVRDLAPNAMPPLPLAAENFYEVHGHDRDYMALRRFYRALDQHGLWLEIMTPRLQTLLILKKEALPFIAMLLFMLALAHLLARFMVKHTLTSMLRVAGTIEAMNLDDFKSWQPLDASHMPQEVHPIIVKFNALIARVQNAMLRLHHLGQYIAHEIRTPLTVIRGEIETALTKPHVAPAEYAATMQSTLDEVTKIDGIINSVMRLAASQNRLAAYAPQKINLQSWLQGNLDKLAAAAGVTLQSDAQVSAGISIFVDPDLFELLLSNLLRNIGKHVGRQTTVRFSVLHLAEDVVVLQLHDNGSGMRTEILHAANSDQVHESDLGIGLNLCKQIASINRLQLTFGNHLEVGLVVRIGCPLAY